MKTWPAVLLLAAACTFDDRVPDTAQFSCSADADCPTGKICQRAEGRCITPAGLGDVAVAAAALRYRPAATNPLSVVSAANAETALDVDVTLNQPVTCLGLRAQPDVVAFSLASAEATACHFTGRPRADAGESSLALEAAVRDDLGVDHLLPVTVTPAAAVDTVAPPAPDVDTAGAIVYQRSPFGAWLGGPQVAAAPTFSHVRGAAGSAAPGATVQVVELDHDAGAGTGLVSPTGAFGPISVPGDAEGVAVAAIDGAGNASPRAAVRDVVWVANHDGRRVNAASTNPHRAFVRAAHTGARVQAYEVEVPGDLGLGRPDDRLARATGGVGLWQRRGQELPGALTPAAIAFDSRRGRMVAVVGQTTYAWDGESWAKIADGPIGFATWHLAYDPLRDRVYAYGPDVVAFEASTWEFDGRSWLALDLDVQPSPRAGAYFAWDPTLKACVLVGGSYSFFDGFGTQTFTLSDAWSFDGRRWSMLRGSPFVNTGHTELRGAYDLVRGEHVLFGGGATDAGLPGDGPEATLIFTADGGLDVRAATGPARRTEHCMVWDPDLRAVLLMGGRQLTSSIGFNDVWSWSGSGWAQLTADAGQPGLGRTTAACAYDLARDEALFVSNGGTRGLRAGQLVERAPPPASPRARGIIEQTATGAVLALPDAGTWSWARGGWSRLRDAGGPAFTQLAADPAGQVYGLSLDAGSASVWALANGVWSALPGSATVQSPSLFYEADAGALVLDGTDVALRYEAASWVPVRTTDAGTRQFHAVYSPAHRATIYDEYNKTRVWSGSTWGDLPVVLTYNGSSLLRLSTDLAGGRVFRARGDGIQSDLQVLNRERWQPVELLNPRAFTPQTVVAFNPARARLLAYDAVDGGDQTHELSLAELRPAVVSHFALPDLSGRVVRSLSVDAVAGGTGGARLRLWWRSRWADPTHGAAAANLAAPAAPTALALTVEDPLVLDELLRDERELTVAIEPNLENGSDAGVVAVDYLELTLRYRTP